MPDFHFRMQKLLEYREMREEWAKDALLDSQNRLREGRNALTAIQERRAAALGWHGVGLADRRSLESYLCRLDTAEHAQEQVVALLEDDEALAREERVQAKQDLEALEKVRDKDMAEWKVEENRREQREIDDWASLRRAA